MNDEDGSGEAMFAQHLAFSELLLGIKEGRFFQGRLNVSRLTLNEATVNVQGLKQEILIQDAKDQNRALNGDVVAVEVLPKTKWIKGYRSADMADVLDDKEAIEDLADEDDAATTAKLSLVQAINESRHQVTGRIVGVVKKMVKTYGGSILCIDDMLPATQLKYEQFAKAYGISTDLLHSHYRVFVPYNGQIPQVLIKSKQPAALEHKRMIVRITQWPVRSPFPFGQFVKIIGQEGRIKTETDMILHEYNVDTRPFSQKVLNCLSPEGKNWQASPEEMGRRWDLRHLDVCSVDPPGCKDIDDALHCIILPNGNYEVGVHIADVSHFVKAGTEIDKEAARRCTTVYMVDRRTDMLPALLTENLCSLVSKVDRMSFSVIWEIDYNTFECVNARFGKSCIKSRASLTYYQA